MGNEILGRRSSTFFKGFTEAQVQYVRDKFEVLRDDKGLLSRAKFMDAYRCSEAFATKAIKFIDFTENGQVDEYEFLCGIAALCNADFAKLTDMLFQILTGGKEKLTETNLQIFTSIAMNFNQSVEGKPDLNKRDIMNENKKKFKQWDVDKSGELEYEEFKKMCLIDRDYKRWMFSMGLITRRQLENEQELYDEVDEDLEQEFKRHTTLVNPNENALRRGIEHGLEREKLQEFDTASKKADKQAVSVKKVPWREQVNYIGMNIKELDQPPSQNLTLDYVYGYRSYDCRNNLKYNSKGKVVYHSGALGIVLDPKQNRQDFMMAHNDDVTCLDINKDRAVTGELGLKPIVTVWNTEKQDGQLKVEYLLTDGLKESVGNVTISTTRPLVAASCNNQDHDIVIFDLKRLGDIKNDPKSKQTGVIAQGPSSKSIIVDMKFTSDEKFLVVATSRELLFTTFKNKELKSNRGNFGSFSATVPVVLTVQDGLLFSGMTNNAIYVWEKDTCTKTLVGHQAIVTALCPRSDRKGILSGDKLGTIIAWSDKLTFEKTFQLTTAVSALPMIVALSMTGKSNILVGTRGSDILQFRMEDKSVEKGAKKLVEGHYSGDLKAMCIHPKSGCFYTGGEDRRLIKWKFATEKRAEKIQALTNIIRCLDVNGNLNTLAVGFSNGTVEFYDAQTLAKKDRPSISNFKNPDKEVLGFVKFDRDGKYLAIGYSPPNACIMLYDMMSNTKKTEVVLKGKPLHADFSNDSKFLQINTSQNEYLAFTLPTMQPLELKNFGQLKDQSWASQSLTMAGGLEGIYSEGITQLGVVCCQVSPIAGAKRKRTTIVGDCFSQLKLFNYPCINQKVYNRYKGHSSYISEVRFTDDEKYVVSVGAQEKAVFLWKYDSSTVDNEFNNEDQADLEEGQEADPNQDELDRLEEATLMRQQQFENFDIVEQEQGEQAMAVKAFLGNIKAPSSHVDNEARDNHLPKEELQIGYVFGIRNFYLNDEVRNQCRYTKNFKSIVFPAAALGIRMDIESKDQSYYRGHRQDIVSFAIDPRREIMATGQMAGLNTKNPLSKIVSIHVWDIDSAEELTVLKGFHTRAVVLLEFSANSKLLFSCGNDDKNSYAVYDWRAGIILHNGPVCGAKVNGVAWRGEQFATCGNRHVKFWSKNKSRQGKIEGVSEPMFAICCSKRTYITGSGTGKLYNWPGDSTSSKPIAGHQGGKIQTLRAFNDAVYSGGDDGLLLMWKTDANGSVLDKPERVFDVRMAYPNNLSKQFSQNEYGVLSVDFSQDGRLLLVTNGCDILQIDRKPRCEILLSGHCKDQLWGLVPNKLNDDLFVTSGDDGTVRLWSISKRRQLSRLMLIDKDKEAVIRGLDWTPDGRYVIAADNKAFLHLISVDRNNSLVEVGKPFRTKTTDIVEKRKFKKGVCFVEEVKISPNGRFIIIGAHAAGSLFEVIGLNGETLSLVREHKTNITSALLHADWSTKEDLYVVNSQGYQLKFFNATNGQQVRAADCRDAEWETWTCKIGWPSMGIFQGVDYSDVNTVCRNKAGHLLAAGYDDQMVRLFRYPAYVPKQVCKQYAGHSSHITRVRFNNEHLISVGGNDKTIIIWNIVGRDHGMQAFSERIGLGMDDDGEFTTEADIDVNVDLPVQSILHRQKPKEEGDEFKVVVEGGEEFMAVKPWLGAIKEPSVKFNPHGAQLLPPISVELEYVYGYRTKDCRQNLFYTNKNEVVYHAAAVVIHHNFEKNTQQLITDHNDDILSLAYHASKGLVLTGELGPKPFVCLSKDERVIRKWRAPVTKGVMALAISPSGGLAVCVGMDDKHQLAVIDLEKDNKIVAQSDGGRQIILKVGWIDQDTFVTVGIKHFKQWYLKGNRLEKKQSSIKNCFVSLAIGDGLVLTGSERNTLMSWKGTDATPIALSAWKGGQPPESKKVKELVDSSLSSVIDAITIQQNFVAAGCKNHLIFILNKQDLKNILNIINLEEDVQLASMCSSVRALDFADSGSRMLVGTLASEIYQITFSGPVYKPNIKPTDSKRRVAGHYSPNNKWTNEVWGLCMDPQSNRFFTCSDDATIRCWDMKTHEMLSCQSLNWGPKNEQGECKPLQKDQKTKDFSDAAKGRVVALSPDRDELIVGCKNGVIRVYSFNDRTNEIQYQLMFRKSNEEISDIKMTPGTLVIGSHDNWIYVYDYEAGKIKERFATLKKHSSYITHMDISRDGANLHSTCGAYELLFWDLNSGKQLAGGTTMLRNEHWATWTTTLGWPVQGIWPKCADGTFYNAVDRSHFTLNGKTFKDDALGLHLLATGNDLGKVNIFHYPCLEKGALSVQCRGHSSHVTNIRWNADDTYLISTGGEDQCIMQWRVNKSTRTQKPRK